MQDFRTARNLLDEAFFFFPLLFFPSPFVSLFDDGDEGLVVERWQDLRMRRSR